MDTIAFSSSSFLMFPNMSLVITLKIDDDDISKIERPSPYAELSEKHTDPGKTLNLNDESAPDGTYMKSSIGNSSSLKRNELIVTWCKVP